MRRMSQQERMQRARLLRAKRSINSASPRSVMSRAASRAPRLTGGLLPSVADRKVQSRKLAARYEAVSPDARSIMGGR